jgi:hypothetical protein
VDVELSGFVDDERILELDGKVTVQDEMKRIVMTENTIRFIIKCSPCG